MSIENIIIHEIQKEEEHSGAEILFRSEENEINAHAEDLSSQLSKLFRKTGLNTGKFTIPENDDDSKPHFVTLLESYFDGENFSDFVAFSTAAAREFKKNLDQSRASRGGYLWFNHYTYGDEHFLTVVLLRKKSGLALSNDLTLDEIEQLDLDSLHMAARINLSAWLAASSMKFIAFRIGKSAKDVTDYFSSFIGCEEYTRAKADTNNLVQVTKKFCSIHQFDDGKSESVKQFVFDRCIDWMNEGEPVLIDRISTLLDESFNPDNSGQFLEIAQSDPFYLSNEIPIEKSALQALTRYSGRSKKLSISFDSDLLNVSVFYNQETGEMIITDLPGNLKQQLVLEDPS